MIVAPSRSSVGTLKSTRTRTRFPRTSRSRMVSLGILLLLLLVTVLVLDSKAPFPFPQHISPFRKPPQHSDQHLHQPDEMLFCCVHIFCTGEPPCHQHIERSCAFKGRASRHLNESRSIPGRE